MEDVRRGWKGTNIFETLGIREAMRERGRMDAECWAWIIAVAGTLLCGEKEGKIMVADGMQDSKLS